MSVWLSQADKILHKYLERSYGRPARQLSAAETDLVLELRKLEKDMNVCVTEVILIKQILKTLNTKELYWIINNLERIGDSLIKQRKLICAAKIALMSTRPNDEELHAILEFKPKIAERIRYLNAIPIPENILLTPLHDYVQLSGADSFSDIIRKKFPTAKAMVDIQEDREQMNLFIEQIQDGLKQAGRENDYCARLNEYIKRTRQKEEKEKADKAMRKREESLREGQNGMLIFKDLFCKGIRTLEGNSTIRLSRQAISTHMAQGHRGKFCVLCCYLSKGQFTYRYIKEDGTPKNNFTDIGLYQTYDDANNAIVCFKEMWPDRVFEAVAI